MNAPASYARIRWGLALGLLGATLGYVVPGSCRETLARELEAATQVTPTAWIPTGNLNVARAYHTATLLPNGKVLVVGGTSADSYPENGSATAELYDPATETWSVTGRLNAAKSGHTATLLPNGQVLVVGQANNLTDGAELYDPDAGTWKYTSAGTGGVWRDQTATLLQTGNVLLAGGWGSAYGSYRAAALYDPATGTWSTTASLLTQRGASHRATLLDDGRVLVTGGTNDADFAFGLVNAELYDPVASKWNRAADLQVARYGHSATLLPGGTVLVAGGDSLTWEDFYLDGSANFPANNTSEVLDPLTQHWRSTGNLSTGRSGHTASLLPNGEVLVAGGFTFTPPNSGAYTKKAERYDLDSGLWRETSDLNIARSAHTATLLPNGKVLIAGGFGPNGILNSAELYGPAPPGTIVSAFTGSWFDPAQNGHGLLIEVLPANQFLVAWFAFNPAGTAQAWFTGVGTYSGNTATVTAVYQPTGGRWIPNFDPNRVVDNAWGTLKFTFSDCNNGKVEFASISGYGVGSMNLTRLTQPDGLTCP